MDFFASLEKFRVGGAPLQRLPWFGFAHGRAERCSFSAYPGAYGWTDDQIRTIRQSDAGPAEQVADPTSSLALLQSWLIFGALEDALDCRITIDQFVVQTGNGSMVSMRFLRPLVWNWMMAQSHQDPAAQIKTQLKIQAILTEMQHWSSVLHWWSPKVDWASMVRVPKPPVINHYHGFDYGVESLGRLLTITAEILHTIKARPAQPYTDPTYGIKPYYTDHGKLRLLYKLVQAGRCPYMARVLTQKRFTVAEYATFWPSLIPPFEVDRHRLCTVASCVGYAVDTGTYRPRHICPNGQCETVRPDSLLPKVIGILESGGVPVLDLEEEIDIRGQRIVKLNVVDAFSTKPPIRYAAFSHVWSDGLGSCTEFGLPNCRLRELFKSAAGCGHGLIWIDSLCVPSAKGPRRLAIRRMADTYRKSACTIVLDRTLTCFRYCDPSDGHPGDVELMLLRFVTSAWMQRLWTVQEGLLSKFLVFRFKDCMVTGEQIAQAILQACRIQMNPVIQSLSRAVTLVLHPDWPNNYSDIGLGDVARMLRLRSTTKPGDETLAIAGLLDVDAAELVGESSHQLRMQKFLQMLKSIPASIIFLDGPKLTAPGWRWAPCSFLSQASIDHGSNISPMTMESRHFQGAWLGQCLATGGLLVAVSIFKLDQRASLQDHGPDAVDSVIVETHATTLRIVPGIYTSLGDFEFDGVVTHARLRGMKEIWIGIAVAFSKPDGEVPAKIETAAAVRRVILRDMSIGSVGETVRQDRMFATEFPDCQLIVT